MPRNKKRKKPGPTQPKKRFAGNHGQVVKGYYDPGSRPFPANHVKGTALDPKRRPE